MTNKQKKLSQLAIRCRKTGVSIPLSNEGIHYGIIARSIPLSESNESDGLDRFSCDFEQDFRAWVNKYHRIDAKDIFFNWSVYQHKSYKSSMCHRGFQFLCNYIRGFIQWYFDFITNGYEPHINEPMPEYADLCDFAFWTYDFTLGFTFDYKITVGQLIMAFGG